jgi:hypothetical protein
MIPAAMRSGNRTKRIFIDYWAAEIRRFPRWTCGPAAATLLYERRFVSATVP